MLSTIILTTSPPVLPVKFKRYAPQVRQGHTEIAQLPTHQRTLKPRSASQALEPFLVRRCCKHTPRFRKYQIFSWCPEIVHRSKCRSPIDRAGNHLATLSRCVFRSLVMWTRRSVSSASCTLGSSSGKIYSEQPLPSRGSSSLSALLTGTLSTGKF